MATSDITGSRMSGDSTITKPEAPLSTTIKITERRSRRQWALIGITASLNFLLWSSLLVLVTSFYLLAADADDKPVLASAAMTIVSSLASVGYIVTHTVFSVKQGAWKRRKYTSRIGHKTTYIAVRFAVMLVILWLLTCSWNMITVARRPVCLPAAADPASELAGWEAGTSCQVFRVGVAFGTFAL